MLLVNGEKTTEIEHLTLHINGIGKCTTEALNNLDTKQNKFEGLNQEKSGFTYLKKTEQTGWRMTKNASTFNL